MSLLGGSYKAKSAEAFALMKLVQVKLLLREEEPLDSAMILYFMLQNLERLSQSYLKQKKI